MGGGWVCTKVMQFVDFEKVFNSVHREGLSKTVISYETSGKMMRLIADIHQGFESAVINGSETSDWLMIKTGVKLGCMMSGFSALLEMD